MIAKKNPRYDLERKRFVFFQTGLLAIGALTLAAFTWESPIVQNHVKNVKKDPIFASSEIIQQEKKDEPVLLQNDFQKEDQKQQIDVKIDPNELSKTTSKNTQVTSGVNVKTTLLTGFHTIIKPNITLPDLDLDDKIVISDIEASYVGGFKAMQEFIQKNLLYPQIPQQMGIQGKVYVQFVIEKDGSITNIDLKRGVDEDLDREAKRIVRKMPKWIAGETAGRKVRTYVNLPINFILH